MNKRNLKREDLHMTKRETEFLLIAAQNNAIRTNYGLVSLFNGISTIVCYLMPKPFFEKNSCGTI